MSHENNSDFEIITVCFNSFLGNLSNSSAERIVAEYLVTVVGVIPDMTSVHVVAGISIACLHCRNIF